MQLVCCEVIDTLIFLMSLSFMSNWKYNFEFQLDTHALRKYALAMAKIEQGEGGISPYLVSQVPSPPRTARSKSARAQGRRSYRKDKQGAPGNEKRAPVLVSFQHYYCNSIMVDKL